MSAPTGQEDSWSEGASCPDFSFSVPKWPGPQQPHFHVSLEACNEDPSESESASCDELLEGFPWWLVDMCEPLPCGPGVCPYKDQRCLTGRPAVQLIACGGRGGEG